MIMVQIEQVGIHESDFMIPIHLNFTDSDAWFRFLLRYCNIARVFIHPI